jgi:phosphate-selective porin
MTLSARAVILLAATTSRFLAAQSPPAAQAPTIALGGYLQARESWRENAGLTASINRARLAAAGTVAPAVTYRLQAEFRTGSVGPGKASVSLQDAFIRFARGSWALQAGQFKTPFAREFVLSLADLESADRATVVDSLAPKRDIGVLGEYTVAKAVTAYAGVFNGEGQNLTANRDSTVLGVARLVVRPLAHLSVGLNAARYFGDSTRYGADAGYEDDRLSLRAEYLAQARDALPGDDDSGWYALGAYTVRPEIQVLVKYESFERPAVPAGARNRAWTAGANAFPFGRSTRLTLQYVSRALGRPGDRSGTLLAQAQVKY